MYKTLILLTFFFTACKENVKEQNAESKKNQLIENNQTNLDSLYNQVLLKGDTLAFIELRNLYFVDDRSNELLYLSVIMSEKYGYRPAFKTNYYILKNYKQQSMQRLAIYNLIRSYELGNRNDLDELNEIFPDSIPKSSDYFSINTQKLKVVN